MTTQPDPKTVREIAYPGRPGSRWRDNDGDMWILGSDGKMRQARKPTVPEDVERVYGPMTPVDVVDGTPAEQPQDERDAADAEPDVCVCGNPNCMPYWRPVHEQMNAMRIRADKVSADFTKGLLEQICELATELDQLKARHEDDQDERDGAEQ